MRLSARTLHVDADKTSPPAAFANHSNHPTDSEILDLQYLHSPYLQPQSFLIGLVCPEHLLDELPKQAFFRIHARSGFFVESRCFRSLHQDAMVTGHGCGACFGLPDPPKQDFANKNHVRRLRLPTVMVKP